MVVDCTHMTVYVDERNPHVWPEIYGLPYDPKDKDLQRWRKKEREEWEAEAKKYREEEAKRKAAGTVTG